MFYQALGSTAGDWNSTKYPGTCKPTNYTALGIARELQAQLNRVAQSLGLSKIAVDGDIGPGTLKLLKAIQAKGLSSGGDPTKALLLNASTASSCTALASLASSVTLGAQRIADERGVSTTVSQPAPPKPVTIVTPQGTEVTAPPQYQSSYSSAINLGGVQLTPLVLLLIGGVAYFLYTSKGKKSSGATVGIRRRTGRTRGRRRTRTTRRGWSRGSSRRR